MLSWSSTESGLTADLSAVVSGGSDGGLPFGREIIGFVDAIGGKDDQQLSEARQRLVEAAGEAFMVDTAAVVANFEMMTRVADGTGARFPAARAAQRAQLDAQLGIGGFTSAR
jgi:hypothetical protein